MKKSLLPYQQDIWNALEKKTKVFPIKRRRRIFLGLCYRIVIGQWFKKPLLIEFPAGLRFSYKIIKAYYPQRHD